ncbi:ABC transporter permease [Crocosphaera sp.]|uniref:ABC transporter permease n=1 Tax=Crocosphaera sp. TaxID=2729996 RepID=UPI003F277FB5|nr:ABC transporter permease [Crocosphaera sp.]
MNNYRPHSIPLTEILSMAIAALLSNKLRTLLTMLGVIIGIASVIAITSVGQGVQKATEQEIQSLGTNVLQVFPGQARTGGISQGLGSTSTLIEEDAQVIQAQVPSAEIVSAYLQQPGQIVYEEDNHGTNIVGIDFNYPEARNTQLIQGRFFTQEEMDKGTAVTILGHTVFDELFGEGVQTSGEKIRIEGNIYEIIGVFETKGSEGSIDRDDQVFIPLINMSSRIFGNNSLSGTAVNGIYVKVNHEERMDEAEFQITNLLRIRHNLSPSQDDDFSIRNQTDVVNTFTAIVGLLTVMVAAIAGISLVVGGIGIANIMLVSVVERTREIGIRKGVGATNSAILQQFLAESVLISQIGGVIGMVTGILIALAAANIFAFPFMISVVSIFGSVGLSLVVGLLAGVIPARNAAKLEPINALRRE